MRISVFTVVMGEYSPEGVAEELSTLGYDAVEWRVHPDFHVHPDAISAKSSYLRSLTQQAGLEVSCLGTYVRASQAEQLDRCCRAAAEMDCPRIRIALDEDYDGRAGFERALAEAKEGLRRAEATLRHYQVRGLLETHHGSVAESASGARRLLSGFSPETYGVIFDPANMILAGRESWWMAVDILGEYLAHVHVKNISWLRDGDGRWQWHYDTLERGMVDWPEVIRALLATGYDGYLSVEDLCGTSLSTSGLAGEAIGGGPPGVSTREKLQHDLTFIRGCLAHRRG
ncbi:MAG: sugar phosphate isomerase/epimerase [Anaerolineae bacterium]|nr:sugar phosphate isomerase/epimerase [Anaerolineae bacterium]